MGRHTGAVCKLCRREGTKLYLKGDRCYSTKCPFEKRSYAPGMHGQARSKTSDYKLRLREKQKARRVYGLTERQFESYFKKASRRSGITGENLLELCERRLDNAVYRLGLASSRSQARQLIRHGHLRVGEHKVNIPSYQVKVGDIITPRSQSVPRFKETVEAQGERKPPSWLTLDKERLEGKVVSLPAREEIDTPVEEHLIVEFYSR